MTTSHEHDGPRPLLSFVIPVYNSQATIRRCLDSIISQMDEPYEIICVDDGSTDGTPAVLDDYAKRYAGVSVMHVGNNGPSAARTLGLQAATGRYMAFADSDDYYAAGRLARIVRQLRDHAGHGVYVFGFWERDTPDAEPLEHRPLDHCEKRVSVSDFLDAYSRPEHIALMNYLFNKVYRADIAKSAEFDSSVSLGEDALYSYACYTSCDDVLISPVSAYVYENCSASSLSRGKDLDHVWTAYRTILDAIEPLLAGRGLEGRLRLLQRSYAIGALHAYIRKRDIAEQDRRAAMDILVYMRANGRAWSFDGLGAFDGLLMRCVRMGYLRVGMLLCAAKRCAERVRK